MVTSESILNGVDIDWDSTAMAATAKRVSDWIDHDQIVAGVSLIVPWTNDGTVIGTFDIEVSNDQVSVFGLTPSNGAVSNTAGPRRFEYTTYSRYSRIVYTNTSGTGTLSRVSGHGIRR